MVSAARFPPAARTAGSALISVPVRTTIVVATRMPVRNRTIPIRFTTLPLDSDRCYSSRPGHTSDRAAHGDCLDLHQQLGTAEFGLDAGGSGQRVQSLLFVKCGALLIELCVVAIDIA